MLFRSTMLAGLGISFANIVRELPGLKQRNLEYIPLDHIFEPGYIAVVMRKDKVLTSYMSAFLNALLGEGAVESS